MQGRPPRGWPRNAGQCTGEANLWTGGKLGCFLAHSLFRVHPLLAAAVTNLQRVYPGISEWHFISPCLPTLSFLCLKADIQQPDPNSKQKEFICLENGECESRRKKVHEGRGLRLPSPVWVGGAYPPPGVTLRRTRCTGDGGDLNNSSETQRAVVRGSLVLKWGLAVGPRDSQLVPGDHRVQPETQIKVLPQPGRGCDIFSQKMTHLPGAQKPSGI